MEFKHIDLPAVWRGREILDRADWLLDLNDEEKLEAADIIRGSGTVVPGSPLHRRLVSIQECLEHGAGASLIRGLDIENESADELKEFFRIIAEVIGTPLTQSADGQVIFSVRDAGLGVDDPLARGPNTKRKLSFHTDRCDVIGFLCLQQAKSGGENQLVSSPALYNEILARRPDLLRVLMQPFYYQRHNVDTANELPYTRQPVFSFYEGHFAANLLRVLIERAHLNPDLPDLSSQQIEALDFLESVAAEPEMHVTFRQQPGDILFLNNWVTLHRRTAFEDHDRPELRRHILRVWLSMPNSRPLDPAFAGNYGATEAGAIRGGMKATS